MILFVDDDPREMDSYRMELEMRDHDVIFESRVDDALAQIERSGEKIDLVILDVMMPTGAAFLNTPDKGLRSGVHFYRQLRDRFGEMPVIIFTNVHREAVRNAFVGDENCWFFQKEHLLPSELADQVAKILLSA